MGMEAEMAKAHKAESLDCIEVYLGGHSPG